MEKNVEDLLRNYQTTSFHLPSPAFHFFHLVQFRSESLVSDKETREKLS